MILNCSIRLILVEQILIKTDQELVKQACQSKTGTDNRVQDPHFPEFTVRHEFKAAFCAVPSFPVTFE